MILRIYGIALVIVTITSGHSALFGQPTDSPLVDRQLYRDLLAAGGWSSDADETTHDERLPLPLAKRLVESYRRQTNASTAAALGLLVLTTSVAEWGVTPSGGLPADPVAMGGWRGPRLRGGKHVMSYSKGGVGIPHADSAFLRRLISKIHAETPNLAPDGARFFRLQGTNFDRLYANGGHCHRPLTVLEIDLVGAPFGHPSNPHAGSKYCGDYFNGATDEKDWQVFRHWIRAALRADDIQFWILDEWLRNYWLPSYKAVLATEGGSVEEAMINARIRNSSSATALCALRHASGATDRIEAQLEAYTIKKCGGKADHRRRFGEMMRPVVLYRALAKG